jgi:stage II sporulation protein D
MEALKAQAVATRTYAIFSIGGSASKEYDMTNDIYSQVYGGENSERYRTGLAVDRTLGQILTINGKTLSAYFHATCGGMTEDAQELWNVDLLPLKGVPCTFCQGSPHFSWKKNFRLKDLQDALKRKGYVIGAIKDIAVVDRNRSGRINNLKITDREGHELMIKGKDFREAIGPNVLKSNNFEVQMLGYFVDFIGKGWGHGVGMCQWGAKGMADGQFNFIQILNYYYPHALIIDYHDLGKSPNTAKSTIKSGL